MVWCKAIIPLKILLFFCFDCLYSFLSKLLHSPGIIINQIDIAVTTYMNIFIYETILETKLPKNPTKKNPIKKNPLNLIHTYVHLVQKCVRKFPNFEFCCLNSFFALVLIMNFFILFNIFCLTLCFFLDNCVNNNFM